MPSDWSLFCTSSASSSTNDSTSLSYGKTKTWSSKKKEIYNSPQKYSISFIRAVKHAQRQWWYNLFLEFNMCGVHREPRRKLLTISVFFKPSYRPSKHLLAFKPFQLCALVLPLWSGFHNWSLLTQTFSLAQFWEFCHQHHGRIGIKQDRSWVRTRAVMFDNSTSVSQSMFQLPKFAACLSYSIQLLGGLQLSGSLGNNNREWSLKQRPVQSDYILL